MRQVSSIGTFGAAILLAVGLTACEHSDRVGVGPTQATGSVVVWIANNGSTPVLFGMTRVEPRGKEVLQVVNVPSTVGTSIAAVWHEGEPVHTVVEYRVLRTPPDVFERWNVEFRVSEPERGRFEVISSDPSILEVVAVRAT